MTFQNDCQALQQTLIFRDVDPAKLKLIAVASHRVEHGTGEVLLREGEAAAGVFVILEGTADVHRKAPAGDVVEPAADARDLGTADRAEVGDDGERLQRSLR